MYYYTPVFGLSSSHFWPAVAQTGTYILYHYFAVNSTACAHPSKAKDSPCGESFALVPDARRKIIIETFLKSPDARRGRRILGNVSSIRWKEFLGPATKQVEVLVGRTISRRRLIRRPTHASSPSHPSFHTHRAFRNQCAEVCLPSLRTRPW